MKDHIHILCIVSVFATVELSACGFELGEGHCDPSKGYMWCDGDTVMQCSFSDNGGWYYDKLHVMETCKKGDCVEFQWPGEEKEASCLISDRVCPNEGDKYVCDGVIQAKCTPDRQMVSNYYYADFNVSCLEWAKGMGWNEKDPLEGLAPTCVGGGAGMTLCAFSTESCKDGDTKCVMSASGRSIPMLCDIGLWRLPHYDCLFLLGLSSEDFPWSCAYSSEIQRHTCAFSTDACTDGETRCVVSQTTGKKALQDCRDGLWSHGSLCSDCTTEPDGTNTCVD